MKLIPKRIRKAFKAEIEFTYLDPKFIDIPLAKRMQLWNTNRFNNKDTPNWMKQRQDPQI